MNSRFRDWPWTVKLGLLLVAAAILPLAASTVYSDVMMRRELVANASLRDLQRARNTAALLDEYLNDLVGDITIVALTPATISVLQDPASHARGTELQAMLSNVKVTKRLPELFVLDYTGTIVASTDTSLVGRNRISAPYFLSAVAGQVRAHDPRYLADDDRVDMHVAAPVRDVRQRVVGVVSARVPLDQIDRLISGDTGFGGLGEYGLLWDEQGIVISSPASPEYRFRPLAGLPKFTRDRLVAERRFGPETAALVNRAAGAEALVQRSRWLMYDDRSDPIVRIRLNEGLQQVATAPMRDRRWTYAIVVPEAAVLAQVDALSQRNVAVAVATALLALVLATGFARRLSRPMNAVGSAARALAAGDLTRRVRLEQQDEIGQMANAFDAMADAIAQKDSELRQHAESLERRVDARTAELRGLLSAIPDLMFRVDWQGRLIDYAAAKEENLARSPDHFLGCHLAEVMPPEVTRPALQALEQALAGNAVPAFDYTLQMGPEFRHYEARTSASGPDNVVFLIRDITERRQLEERTSFLARAGTALTSSLDYVSTVETLAQLPVPFLADICIVDLLEHGTLRLAAVAARTPEIEALVHAVRAEFPVRPHGDHPVARALRGGPSLFETVPPALLRGLARSADHARLMKQIGPVSLIVLPLVARGQTIGAMSLVTTISGRHYTEADQMVARELSHRAAVALDNARLYRDLEESSRMKDEFLGIVSHELRTPLNAVLGWAQVLRRSPHDDEQVRRAVEAIERNARAQAQLVDDLLDTSRVISGKIRLDLTRTELASLVNNAAESVAPIAKARGIDLAASTSGIVGEVLADPARLEQVIGNLLSNAVKFTPAGGSVRVSLVKAGPVVEIRVADSGAGITADFLPFVFDRFRQADSTTTRAHGGLGLGLAIAQHLVELHGGTIRADSAGENKGATFVVQLPLVPRATPIAVQHSDLSVPTDRLLSGLRVLVVDDSKDALDMLSLLITAAGADVATAESVEAAEQSFLERRPDLLIADIAMPRADGHVLVRRIRERERQTGERRVYAIALSAYARDEDRRRSLSAGFDRYLTKPIDPVVVIDILREFAGRRVTPAGSDGLAT
jgi:signal transduction histidine kinase/CheY-like chemotaxis protein